MKPDTLAQLTRIANAFKAISAEIYQEGLQAIASGDHVEVIKHFNDLRGVNALVKEARSSLQDFEDQFSTKHIPEVFAIVREKTGQKPPYNIEGVGKVSVAHRFSCTIITPDKSIGHQWLKDNGHGSLVTETVNSSTLAAFSKDMLENRGEELPDDIFKTSLNPYTSIRK